MCFCNSKEFLVAQLNNLKRSCEENRVTLQGFYYSKLKGLLNNIIERLTFGVATFQIFKMNYLFQVLVEHK